MRLAVLALCFGTLVACKKPADNSEPNPGPSGMTLSFLSLFPGQKAALIGETLAFRVTARDVAGAEVSVSPSYSSANSGVVRVDPDGRIVANGSGTATVRATSGGQSAEATVHVGPATHDLSPGIPRVLTADYIDLPKIERVSRFRSTIGHSYTDSSESCRSMKHYFQPKTSLDWTQVEVFAPATGTIWGIAPDGAFGVRVTLRPRDLPALHVVIFHVTLDSGIAVDTWVEAGQRIGRHASQSTMSDIAMTNGLGGTLLSYFQVMSDDVFARYQGRGVTSRDAAIISRAERDADAVPCSGDAPFTVQGTLPNWVNLN